MQEGSVSLFFGSYGLLFYFYGSGFPACPFSRVSGLPVFPGFRFARFPGLLAFSGFPVCPFFLVSGLPVFSGFRFARFLWFPACLLFRVFRLPVFSGFRLACFFGFSGLFSVFSVFSRSFQPFFGLLGLFSVLYRGFFRFLFCICKVAVLFCPFGRKYTNPVPELQVVDYQIRPFR